MYFQLSSSDSSEDEEGDFFARRREAEVMSDTIEDLDSESIPATQPVRVKVEEDLPDSQEIAWYQEISLASADPQLREVGKLLQTVPEGLPSVVLPTSSTDGTAHGYLLYQGKMRGLWKKGFFVCKPPYLFQYTSDASALSKPKNTIYVACTPRAPA